MKKGVSELANFCALVGKFAGLIPAQPGSIWIASAVSQIMITRTWDCFAVSCMLSAQTSRSSYHYFMLLFTIFLF